jgi:predicted permease
LTPRLVSIAGAEAVALTTAVPPDGGWRRTFEIDGRPVANENDRPGATDIAISAGFFDTVGLGIIRGRDFTPTDGAPGSETVIVNQQFASEFFPAEDPIGRRIRFTTNAGEPPAVWRTIIGVSPLIRHYTRQDYSPKPVVYLPMRQESPSFANLLFRSRVDPGVIMNAVRKEVQALDADQPVYTAQTLSQAIWQRQWPNRVFGTVFGIFAAIALLLSAVGIYAVMAYSVTQRTQEIGVRMALGAEGRQVSWLILKRGLIQLAIGLTLGLIGAWLTSKALRPLLVSIAPTDPATFLMITLIITAVSVAACLIPARRATRLHPLVALREE